MENEIIMNEINEEVIDEVVVPAVEAAETYCSHSGKSKLVPILGAAALIGVIAAGVIIYKRRHRMSNGDEPEVQTADIVDDNADDEDEDDKEETEDA